MIATDKKSNDTIFKKRYRWMLRLKKGDEVLYEAYAKINSRPWRGPETEMEALEMASRPWNSKPLDSEIVVSQYGHTSDEIKEWMQFCADMDTAELVLHDGCAQPIENWVLYDARAAVIKSDPSPDGTHIDTELTLKYSKTSYVPIAESVLPFEKLDS
jgi:hypothetical protein